MRAYGVYEAKTKLPELIRQVQQGERVTITHRGEPVADLVPSACHAAEQAVEAIATIKAMRAGSTDQAEYDAFRRQGRR